MSIASDMIRGHTETIILSHLARGKSYGYEINKAIRDHSGGRYELKEATLYTAFRRMEEAGLISSFWGDEETGARRKYYTLSDPGREALTQRKEEWNEAKEILDKLINLEGWNYGE